MSNPNFQRQSGRTSRNRKPIKPLTPRPRVLIVCQGEKTEPNYFHAFRVADVKILHGSGDPLQVVQFAEEDYDKNPRLDSLWCVFDRDDFPQFDDAVTRIQTLRGRGRPFFAAWSNVCFELWYLLHFEYLQSSISRERYGDKITTHINTQYKKNDETMYDRLRPYEETALRNASLLRTMHDQNGTTLPSNCCPTTKVDELVLFLRSSRL